MESNAPRATARPTRTPMSATPARTGEPKIGDNRAGSVAPAPEGTAREGAAPDADGATKLMNSPGSPSGRARRSVGITSSRGAARSYQSLRAIQDGTNGE